MARIVVVGGSIAGLLVGARLLQRGHEVVVLERSRGSLEGRGAGIVTHPGLRAALRALGVAAEAKLGVVVRSRVVLAADGSVAARCDYPQVLTSWGRLHALLRERLPASAYRLGAAVAGVDADAQAARARLESGDVVEGDLLVACDGLRSTIRARLAPEAAPRYAGYAAWRGVCDEAVLSRRTRETLFPHFGFGVPEGEQIIGYPVAGADDGVEPGRRRWNFVWYRPADAATLAALLTDADGVPHPDGIAPHQVSWRQIAAMRRAAGERLAPQFAEIVEKTALPFVQPIFDLACPRLAFGRIALAGDAAFVARPHVGMGVAKAADDAFALADAIAEQGANAAALARYDAVRAPAGRAVVERARRLGAYLEARAGGAVRVPYRDAGTVMRETATEPEPHETATPAVA